MPIKDAVIDLLEKNRNSAISGQELANRLHVTRAAVWKAIKSLQQDGYVICATPNKGYLLGEQNDVLSPQAIRLFLPNIYQTCEIEVLKSVDSTNLEAKKRAMTGAPHHTLLLSDRQTAGRGRQGKSFFSPPKTGIYMSALFRPNGSLQDALPITAAAAVAVSQAIEYLTDKTPQIKWVNDIYLDGKKICGILTEAVSDFESATVEAVIVGIGINITTEVRTFPPELRETAGSLFPAYALRCRLAAEIASRLFSFADDLTNPALMEEYKKRSMVLGKEITYIHGMCRSRGRVLDITDEGHLLVVSNGEKVVLTAGEIHLERKRSYDSQKDL